MEDKKGKEIFLRMGKDLEKIRDALQSLKTAGLSRDLLVIYVQDRTKLGKQKINSVLDAVEEFTNFALEE